MTGHILFLLISSLPLQLACQGIQSDVLVFNQGDTQVTSDIYVYQTIVENAPIQGSVLITHDSTSLVDVSSFRMGDQPLKVKFERSVPMSSTGTLEVSVYSFVLEGLTEGQHELPPIVVNVGGKAFQAPSMTVDVAAASN